MEGGEGRPQGIQPPTQIPQHPAHITTRAILEQDGGNKHRHVQPRHHPLPILYRSQQINIFRCRTVGSLVPVEVVEGVAGVLQGAHQQQVYTTCIYI